MRTIYNCVRGKETHATLLVRQWNLEQNYQRWISHLFFNSGVTLTESQISLCLSPYSKEEKMSQNLEQLEEYMAYFKHDINVSPPRLFISSRVKNTVDR